MRPSTRGMPTVSRAFIVIPWLRAVGGFIRFTRAADRMIGQLGFFDDISGHPAFGSAEVAHVSEECIEQCVLGIG